MSRVVAIIQARLSSERLPDKVLLQIPPGSGISMLEMVIRKAMLAKTVDEVVVVTPDKELTKICRMLNVGCFVKAFLGRDVLREFYEAAHPFNENADVIVRLTGDCPLIRPEEIDRCVTAFEESGVIDILYNTDESTGQLDGEGSDVEVFWKATLDLAYQKAEEPDEGEHVTLWIRRNMKTRFLPGAPLGLRSVNTQEDYDWVCQYIKGT